MTHKKITELTENTSPAPTDLLHLVDDPSGSPSNQKVQVQNLLNSYVRTSGEIAAGVNPTNYEYEPGNVLRYGAVGDGTTNDVAAIQLAFDYAEEADGEVIFPAGYTFAINGYIQVRNGVRKITGRGGVIKCIGTVSENGILFPGKNFGESANVVDCVVDGLIIDANSQDAVPIHANNVGRCKFINNLIYNVAEGHGILLYARTGGQANCYHNVIANNTVICVNDTGDCYGITLQADLNVTPSANALEYWKANFSAADSTYHCVQNVVSGNKVYGGYYGISFSAARYNTVTGNNIEYNTRNMSMQNVCIGNTVSGNTFIDSTSSAVHMAYGSYYNTVSGNRITSSRATGQGLLQAYVGSTNNHFVSNSISITGTGPQWYLYCGIKSHNCVFENNKLVGPCTRAYIAVESAWNTTETNTSHYAYGASTTVNDFTNDDTNGVVIKGNTIIATSARPAIFLSQISDASGDYGLNNINIENNVIKNTTPNYQLEMIENNSGDLNNIILKGNSFYPTATAAKFSLARGRAHFSVQSGNTVINDGEFSFSDGDQTPSVAVGSFFAHADTGATNVTDYDDGVDGQTIIVRLTTNTTIKHGASLIRLKGSVDATGDSNSLLTLRSISGVWFEVSRNF